MTKHEFTVDLVQKELDGNASTNDMAALASNLGLWREHLASIKRKVEMDLVSKKADSIQKGIGNPQALKEFHEWRRRAVFYKNIVEQKLIEIKRHLREEADADHERKRQEKDSMPDKQDEIIFLLEDIFQELKTLNKSIAGHGARTRLEKQKEEEGIA